MLEMPSKPLEQRIARLFGEHRDSLDRLTAEELRAAARQFHNGSGSCAVFAISRLCSWTGRLILCVVAAAAAFATLSNALVSGGYASQSTEWLAATDLAEQKLLRWVSHSLRLYDTELVRSLGNCLLPNPLQAEPPSCCGCSRLRIVRLGVTPSNLTVAAGLIDSLYNRAVTPFLLAGPGPGQNSVDFARLARFVAEHRPDFERGANVFQTLAAAPNASAAGVRRFADLFPAAADPPPAEPPAGQLLLWSFWHLSAIRAFRRLVPRPAYFGRRTERLLPTSLLLAGRRLPPGRLLSVGDFPGYRALAYATPLSGRLMARLTPKVECCAPGIGGADGSSASEPVVLEPGRALFFPTDCYELLVGQSPEDADEPALVHFGFVYNGAHQAKKKMQKQK